MKIILNLIKEIKEINQFLRLCFFIFLKNDCLFSIVKLLKIIKYYNIKIIEIYMHAQCKN